MAAIDVDVARALGQHRNDIPSGSNAILMPSWSMSLPLVSRIKWSPDPRLMIKSG